LLGDSRIDAVAIATPAATHFPVALAALRAGKHALVEKPLTRTSDQGLALIHESERRGLVLMVDHTYVFSPAVRALRHVLASGAIGREWHVTHDEDLRIVPQEIWDRAAAQCKEIDYTWPQRRTGESVATRQRSYVEANPPHLLSGALHCGVCRGNVGQVSGKGSGYYGCLDAARGACENKLLVSRRTTEKAVLTPVKERLGDLPSVRYVLDRVEAEVQRLQAHLPEEIQVKRAAMVTEERRIANYIEFIGDGKGTRALGGGSEVGRAEGGRTAP
jgi:hypothetical protein